MRKGARFLLLVLVVALAVLLWWLRPWSATSPGTAEEPTARDSGAAPDGTASRSASRRRRKAQERAGAASANDTPTPSDTLPSWVVVVLGPDGVPATGIQMRVVSAGGYSLGGSLSYVLTDANGRATLGRSEAKEMVVEIPGFPDPRHVLTEPTTVLRMPRLLPLELLVVDGQTGAPVHGVRISVDLGRWWPRMPEPDCDQSCAVFSGGTMPKIFGICRDRDCDEIGCGYSSVSSELSQTCELVPRPWPNYSTSWVGARTTRR